MTRSAYFDCFAGVSGDMLLGALLDADAGWTLDDLRTVVDALGLQGVSIEAGRTRKHNLSGTQLVVNVEAGQPLRQPDELVVVIEQSGLAEPVCSRAIAIIRRLAEVEARVHGVALDEVHFHEVGAADTLVDVVGVLAGLHALDVRRVVCSPLPWSHGTLKVGHGVIPLPGPAVAALLEGVAVRGVDVEGEMVTPTGAGLVTGLADSFGPMPQVEITEVGYGAGNHDWPDRPNLLRLVLGTAVNADTIAVAESLTMLACNLDDMNPEWHAPVVEALFAAGALDVWLTPAHMKKGRPAVLLEVLCRPDDVAILREVIFRQTTTLGLREYQVTRWALPRELRTVDTLYGSVRVKVAELGDGEGKLSPEHDDCVLRAAEHGVSVREVWLAAMQAAQSESL